MANERVQWVNPNKELPPEHVEVTAITPAGYELRLKRKGGLWLIGPEFETYGYYEPILWRKESA